MASSMFTTDAPQLIEHVSKSLTFTPSDCRWIPASPRFVVLGEHPRGTGALRVYELAPDDTRIVAESEKPAALKCGTFGASMVEERHLATGDAAGRLAIYNLDAPTAPAVWEVKAAHGSMINAIDGCGGLSIGGGAPELVTGGSDGAVKVWDPRVADPVVVLQPVAGEPARDCWAVAFGNSFSDEERCVAAGYDNGGMWGKGGRGGGGTRWPPNSTHAPPPPAAATVPRPLQT
jgi:WD repeat-containing protein 92